MERNWLLESSDYKIFGATGERISIDENPEFLVFDADWILGRLHVEGAIYHARRTYGKRRVKKLESCLILYLAFTDQINEATQRVFIKPETKRYCFIASPNIDKGTILDAFGLQESEEALAFSEEKARRIFTQEELESTPKSHWPYLALERMALLEIGYHT